MNLYVWLGFYLISAVAASPASSDKIVGGTFTTIAEYPATASVHFAFDFIHFRLLCAGNVINNRSILSCAHCYFEDLNVNHWRVRLGSALASSGGVVYNVAMIIIHPNYNNNNYDNDVAILRTATAISYIPNAVQPISIAGTNYNVADNQVVWAAGWGATFQDGWNGETLRHVQIWTINQSICRERYATRNLAVTDNMLCSGWLDVGGRDQCHGDSGGPLLHNNVLVGISSWRLQCGDPFFPGVNARVSRFTTWIQANA